MEIIVIGFFVGMFLLGTGSWGYNRWREAYSPVGRPGPLANHRGDPLDRQ